MNKRYTLRELAEHFGEPLHNVNYAVNAYGVEPRERVGLIRVWYDLDLERIKAALARVAARRRGTL